MLREKVVILEKERDAARAVIVAERSPEWADQAIAYDLASAERDEFEELLREAHAVFDVPDRNCSCHLSPPCGDCVEYSGIREWLAEVEKTLGPNVPASTGKDGG